MKNYARIACAFALMHGAGIFAAEGTSQGEQKREHEVKLYNTVPEKRFERDSKLFWDTYAACRKLLKPDESHLRHSHLWRMLSVIDKNLEVLQSHYTVSRMGSIVPLTALAQLAVIHRGGDTATHEETLFNHVLSYEKNNSSKLSALRIVGIKQLAYPLVYSLIHAGTDVSEAPDILPALINQCVELEELRKKKQIADRSQVKYSPRARAQHKKEAGELLSKRARLMDIVTLLLNFSADPSQVGEIVSVDHHKTCLNCRSIFNRFEDWRDVLKLQQMLPPAPPTYVHSDFRSLTCVSSEQENEQADGGR